MITRNMCPLGFKVVTSPIGWSVSYSGWKILLPSMCFPPLLIRLIEHINKHGWLKHQNMFSESKFISLIKIDL